MADTAITKTAAPVSSAAMRKQMLKEFWFYFSENKGAVIGLYVFLALVIIAVFAHFIAPHSPFEQYRDAVLLPPAWVEGGRLTYLLGTDPVGRDILSRLIYGAQYSLFIGVFVTTLSLTTGVVIGVLAGYYRGWLDTAIMRLMDIILAFPSLLLALVLVAILGPGLTNGMIAIALVLQPHFVRLTRAAVMAEKSKDYVTASRLAGAGPLRLMFRTILPNCTAPLIVQATLSFSNAILDAAALASSAWARSRPHPNGAPCLPKRVNSFCAHGGSSPSQVLPSSSPFLPST